MLNNSKWICFSHPELAGWKGSDPEPEDLRPTIPDDALEYCSFLFRKEFAVSSEIKKAKLAISGLGFYEAFVNGKKPDERRVLAPVYSSYYKMTRYDVYDVTDLLVTGDNALAVEVCGGWFASHEKWWGWRTLWHGTPRLIAELEIELCDGNTLSVVTDESWKTDCGAVVDSCIYDGETVDFNLLQKGWQLRGFDDGAWNNALVAEPPTDNLHESTAPPVRIIRRLKPTNSWRLNDSQIVFDFGENGAALPYLEVKGKKGDTIRLNHAEFINEDGTLNAVSENRAICEDKFILSGDGVEVCMPRFTYHGYRYMMVTLSSQDIELLDVEKCVIHSDVETIGEFACDNPKLNELHDVYVRTSLACLQGVPVDCEQRDERLPWLGDAHVAAEVCLYNYDMKALYYSLLVDMKIGRSPSRKNIEFISPTHRYDNNTSIDWNIAYPIILDECYRRYGDYSLLEHHYTTLKDHTEYYISTSKDGMIDPCWFGDWFTVDMPEGMEKVSFAAGPEGHRQNPPFAGTMFYVKTLRLAAEIAKKLGKSDDEARFNRARDEAISALRKKYYDPETGIFGSGGQFLLTFALAERIVPDEDREKVFANLVELFEDTDWHSLMGVVGLRTVFDVLYEFDRPDIAFKLLTAEGFPSPMHMLSGGKTTLTEGLDGGGSGCHTMFASPDAALYRVLGGITINRNDNPFITIKPYCPKELNEVACSQKIAEGKVVCNWRREGELVHFELEIPKGTVANVILEGNNDKIEKLLSEGSYSFSL